jgi:hypothetical protein
MFPIIEVSGSAHERGRMHGEIARERVVRSLSHYAHLFEFCGIGWDEARRRAGAYRNAIGALDASLLEEIDGIAAGAGRKPDEILALNARTELLPPAFLGKVLACRAQQQTPFYYYGPGPPSRNNERRHWTLARRGPSELRAQLPQCFSSES